MWCSISAASTGGGPALPYNVNARRIVRTVAAMHRSLPATSTRLADGLVQQVSQIAFDDRFVDSLVVGQGCK
jgi:hypothetical protein